MKAVGAAAFAKAWADDTSATAPAPAAQWKGMLVADVTGAATSIAADSVASLFDAATDMSLLNTTWASAQVWRPPLFALHVCTDPHAYFRLR